MSVKRYSVGVDGVDPNGNLVKYTDYAALEARCAALAAEMAWFRKFCKDAAFDADYETELGMERGGFTDALNNIKTPATDAFLAELLAQGVDSAINTVIAMMNHQHPVISKAIDILRVHAYQIRKGVQS